MAIERYFGEVTYQGDSITLFVEDASPSPFQKTVTIATEQYHQFLTRIGEPVFELTYEKDNETQEHPPTDETTVLAQTLIHGKPRLSHYPDHRIGLEVTLPKRSVLVFAEDIDTGDTVTLPAREAPIDPSHLPRASEQKLGDAISFRRARRGASLESAKRRKTTQTYVNIDDRIRARGGNPHHRLDKSGGRFLKEDPKVDEVDEWPPIVYEEHDPADDLPFE